MLPLESPEWGVLNHAYGPAKDIPRLLRELAGSTAPVNDCRSEPWYSLWSSLCHQGDVYIASYAAIPHVIQIGAEATSPIHHDFFLLPAAVEVSRSKGRGPELPTALAARYSEAMSQIFDCALKHIDDPWDRDMALSVAAAMSAAKGQTRVADAILNLNEDVIGKIIAGDF